jgi:hypothetical protein
MLKNNNGVHKQIEFYLCIVFFRLLLSPNQFYTQHYSQNYKDFQIDARKMMYDFYSVRMFFFI